jgi:hypothetical protein
MPRTPAHPSGALTGKLWPVLFAPLENKLGTSAEADRTRGPKANDSLGSGPKIDVVDTASGRMWSVFGVTDQGFGKSGSRNGAFLASLLHVQRQVEFRLLAGDQTDLIWRVQIVVE